MTPFDLLVRLLLAAGLGALLGLEREWHRKAAGLRTNMLIALGAALFTAVSLEFARYGGTPDRIASQLVTGIGFLGAGAILRSGTSIHGLTTAATIWVNAAVGMSVGAGEFGLAIVATGVALVVLVVIQPFERYFERRADTGAEPRDRRSS